MVFSVRGEAERLTLLERHLAPNGYRYNSESKFPPETARQCGSRATWRKSTISRPLLLQSKSLASWCVLKMQKHDERVRAPSLSLAFVQIPQCIITTVAHADKCSTRPFLRIREGKFTRRNDKCQVINRSNRNGARPGLSARTSWRCGVRNLSPINSRPQATNDSPWHTHGSRVLQR